MSGFNMGNRLWATSRKGILSRQWPMALSDLISKLLWITGDLGVLAALVIVIWRRIYRDFPLFSSYLVCEVVQSILGLLLYAPVESPHYPRFFWAYWVGQSVQTVLSFAVIYEIFSSVFRSYEGLRELGAILFRWVAVTLLLISVVVAASSTGPSYSRIVSAILLLDRSISVVQCGLLFFLFLLSSYLGLTWRHQAFGIVLGFGMIASAELAAVAVRLQIGSEGTLIWDFTRRGTYVAGLAVWIAYLLRTEPQHAVVPKLPQSDLAKWNNALLHLLQR